MGKFGLGCLKLRHKADEVTVLDYRHCSLDYIPSDVFTHERTLEELHVDANQISELPRELFYCHGLRKLVIADNELTKIPPAIGSLINLEELNFSKNGVVDLPDNIKMCKYLRHIEASVNPLGKIPEGFTQLLQLTELYLNDTFLDFLPGSFGRLNKLKILEIRENHLKTLPKSVSRLTQLERLDIGNNDFNELPDVVGGLISLLELWCDSNQIKTFPNTIGGMKQLMFLDASKNRIETLPAEIDGCISLADLHLSTNLLQSMPESIGRLSNLTTLKVDDNRLTSLPFSIGGLVSISEMNISANDLEEIPPSIGLLRHLRTLYADENFLMQVPCEMGSCSGLTVLSLRSNNLTSIPDTLGRIPRLRVLNLSDNRIKFLPFSLTKLRELQALWLAENQTKPLIKLQSDIDIDTGIRMLTCYLLPQQPHDDRDDEDARSEGGNSFHPSVWEEERERRTHIHFDFDEPEPESRLERIPTPYPKDMKDKLYHMRNLAMKQSDLPNGDVRTGTGPAPTESVPGRRTDTTHTGTTHAAAQMAPVISGEPKPTSPLLGERHHLIEADKKRQQKDKARFKQSRKSDTEDDKSEVGTSSRGTTTKNGDDGGFLTPGSKRRGTGNSPSSTLTRDQSMSLGAPPPQHGAAALQHPGPHSHRPSPRSHAPPLARPPHQHHQQQQPYAPPVPPPPHMPHHSQPDLNIINHPDNYHDFLRGLNQRGVVVPQWQGVNKSLPGRYHPQQQGQRSRRSARGRSQGYESDLGGTGYYTDGGRSDGGGGYRSDTGYRSETGHLHRAPPAPPPRGAAGLSVRDGYSSDRDSLHRRRRGQPQPSGYSSDSARRTSRGAYNNGAVPAANPNPNPRLSGSNQHVPPSPYSQLNNSHKYPPPELQHQAPPPGYSNTPLTNRITIRPDEMYPGQAEGAPPPEAERGRPGSVVSDEQSVSGRSVRGSIREEPEPAPGGSSDDDQYKAQLYKASVKLQKSPSEKSRLSASIHEDTPRPRTDSDPHASRSGSLPRGTAAPPSYRPTPPYSPPKPHRQLNLGASHAPGSGLDSPRSVASHHSQRSSRSGVPSEGSVRRGRRHEGTPSRPSTLPVGASMSEPRPRRGGSSAGAIRPPSFAQELNFNATSHPDLPTAIKGPSISNTTSHPNLAWHQQRDKPPSIDTSSHYATQYDTDVAVYKQHDTEPPSQVSSSTDSGYGHGQAFDSLRGSIASPGQTQHAGFNKSPPRQGEAGLLLQAIPERSQPSLKRSGLFQVSITKNPGLGFSIAGGSGSPGNPYRPEDKGIFITKVQTDGPAATTLLAGDKILQVNNVDFRQIEHNRAVEVLRNCQAAIRVLVERIATSSC